VFAQHAGIIGLIGLLRAWVNAYVAYL
jgi:hypothetical protein